MIMLQHITCIFVVLALIAVSYIEAAECDCKETKGALDYNGTTSTTISGYTCQAWDAQTPNKHDKNDVDKYPNAVNNKANYCRNPNEKPKGPWCYTLEPGVRIEYCDIQLCSDCPVNYCDPNPCRNGGVCTSGPSSYSCACPDHCSGSMCELCIKTVNVDCNTFDVPIETDSEGHTWMVLMRRYNGDLNFTNKAWADYKTGFGDLSTEFWLGNDNMHYLTSSKQYLARFNMESFTGESRYAEYNNFAIESETENYRLTLGEYSGTAGDAMQGDWGNLRNQSFTTSDRDNDNHGPNCALMYHGAWWYDACSFGKFTGEYGQTVKIGVGIHWQTWLPATTGLQYVEIRVRENAQVNTINVDGHSFDVLIDTDSSGNDWTVLMRRYDGSVEFPNMKWADYKNGFGDLTTEFWLGNDKMHYLTSSGTNYIARFDMNDCTGESRYAEYNAFAIGDESSNYKLTLGDYSGTAGDAMQGEWGNLRNQSFTTSDRDNDNHGPNCALMYHGAWWYDACSFGKFTGEYGQTVKIGVGIHWQTWLPATTGLGHVEIKIRPA